MHCKTLRDAVHGDIQLHGLVMEVVDTRPFQRLRGVKQLGTASLVFPCATHSRFEHSLGACWLAGRLLGALRQNAGQPDLLRDTEPALLLAALLHDITHVPFGHTFEDERRLFPRHDESPERLSYFLDEPPIGPILKREGLLETIRAILERRRSAEGPVRLARDLVAGTLSADLLDYLKRDAFFCGLALGYDERLYRYVTPLAGGLGFDLQQQGRFRPDALSEVIHLLRLRYTLTERVYYHHAKVASGAMISRALELALAAGLFRYEELYGLRDDAFLDTLARRSVGYPDLESLVDDFLAHRLYRRAHELQPEGLRTHGVSPQVIADLEGRYHHNTQGARTQFEETLAGRLGVRPGDVILSCPSGRMALKEADVLVAPDTGPPVRLSDLRYPEVEVLRDKYQSLWRFTVYVSRRCPLALAEVQECCKELLASES